MKKIKKITLILIIIITIIGITYRGKITAYAEKYDFNKIEINKVYNKGDILTIYDLEEIYSGSSYPAELSQMHVINYQDKAGNDLYIYFSGTFGSGVISLSSLTVGADLATGLKNNILELYNIMKKYKIAFSGTYDIDNFGDHLFPIIFKNFLRKKNL